MKVAFTVSDYCKVCLNLPQFCQGSERQCSAVLAYQLASLMPGGVRPTKHVKLNHLGSCRHPNLSPSHTHPLRCRWQRWQWKEGGGKGAGLLDIIMCLPTDTVVVVCTFLQVTTKLIEHQVAVWRHIFQLAFQWPKLLIFCPSIHLVGTRFCETAGGMNQVIGFEAPFSAIAITRHQLDLRVECISKCIF